MLEFKKARRIWENQFPKADEYAEFREHFSCDGAKEYFLCISADSDYTVCINGNLAAFGQYACYPERVYGDRIDISKFITNGDNIMSVVVWYYGYNSSTYTAGKAGVIYEITGGDDVIAYSSSKTESRTAPGYVSHKVKPITGQLGLTYEYDANDEGCEFSQSFETDAAQPEIYPRPICKTVLENRTFFKKVFGGTYEYIDETGETPEDMCRAALTFINSDRSYSPDSPFTIESDNGRNVYFIIDLGSEESGFLDFDITLPDKCRIDIAYGEHLSDGRVRTRKRNFTCIYHAKKGRNSFLNTFRRFGCRYLQFFIGCKKATVDYAGLRPVEYPLKLNDIRTGNLLRDTITDVSVKTLRLCMHEHYEDCPWREQSLYTMDSRNQALAGYIAFGEYAFPRAAFSLMSQKLRPDGLMSLCAPGGTDFPIPSFNCAYFIEMNEYIKYSGDITLAAECYDKMVTIMNTLLSRKRENNLYINFYAEENSPYWNFFEWSPTLSGRFGETVPSFECPLNAFISIALQNFADICKKLGKTEEAGKYLNTSRELNKNIKKHFLNEQSGLFESFLEHDKGSYSALVNALCVLCGAADGIDTSVIKKVLLANGAADTGLCVIPNTISMNIYRFDALLKLDGNTAHEILNEIDITYLYMLRAGATTFWETLKGEDDFDGVGSLCHGWSALPIYYYNLLLGKE